ncbi:MAG: MFS transporter, partial [Prevotellaceae bacterium]|nr:MFS transporter [Prevotellaceae bacterium]
MSQQKQNGNIVAIITMVFLFAMISFVTNLAVPLGDLWKERPALVEAGNFWGKMGNMMNFLAYLFMGIPAGNMLAKFGYKKTALAAIAVGFFGILVQFLSGTIGETNVLFNIPVAFFIYLLGAFISGFSVCMLNTVVNPMLNLLGGGGNRGNQYIQIGGTFNSLV